MCGQKSALPSATNSEPSSTDTPEQSSMDPHFLLDIFTLCAVATLVVILILTRVMKKRRLALAHQTKCTQTENPVPNLDESINRLANEMSTLQDRLEHLEQERLEAVTSNRMQPPLANNTEYCSEDPELANHGQPTWPGAWPKYPAV